MTKFSEEDFSEYFNNNKALLKLLLFKEKKSIVKNNEYELTKENIYENNLYSKDNLDKKNMNERTKKALNN